MTLRELIGMLLATFKVIKIDRIHFCLIPDLYSFYCLSLYMYEKNETEANNHRLSFCLKW